MKLVLKLLLGLGEEEDFTPEPLNVFMIALLLGSMFFGSILVLILIITRLIL